MYSITFLLYAYQSNWPIVLSGVLIPFWKIVPHLFRVMSKEESPEDFCNLLQKPLGQFIKIFSFVQVQHLQIFQNTCLPRDSFTTHGQCLVPWVFVLAWHDREYETKCSFRALALSSTNIASLHLCQITPMSVVTIKCMRFRYIMFRRISQFVVRLYCQVARS